MGSNRRQCLKTMIALGAVAGAPGMWGSRLAAEMRTASRQRHLVVLWMPGGPSQMDTFDLKPGHSNGGPFQEIATSVPGMKFSEHLGGLSKLAHHLCLLRGMQTKEGDHSRGTYLLRTGQSPGGPVRFPSISSALGKELSADSPPSVPGYVSILPNAFISPPAFSAGFLGASREPLTVAGAASLDPLDATSAAPSSSTTPVDLRVDNLLPPPGLDGQRLHRRRQFWELLQDSYGAARRSGPAAKHDIVYRRAMQLAESELVDAFDLSQESDDVRRSYGIEAFGQGCLMARRLIERGVPVVEVSLSAGPGGLGWDTHNDNFTQVKDLSERLDRAWSRLIIELEERGLLEQTTFAWLGEFGRTPQINESSGRDHFPNAWSCVLGGAGVAGGAIVGKTSADGMEVVDRPTTAVELLATVCQAVGVSPDTENYTDDHRPVKIVEGEAVQEALT
jgi:hypothetical protein